MKGNRTIITAAVTGSMGDKSRYPNLPVTPKEIAESAVEAWSAGASVAHIHVRDPHTAEPSMDLELYRETVERIRASSDMLINLSTGPGARIIPGDSDPVDMGEGTMWRAPEKRTEHVVDLRPEICSLDVGSMNFGPRVFANAVPHIEEMAKIIKGVGVKPELEVFDLGHIGIANWLIKMGLVKTPPMFQLCLGIRWGIGADTRSMVIMKEMLPPDAVWGAFGIGQESFRMVAQSALMGGNVRVGFEDNFFLAPGRQAASNAELVEKAVRILTALDIEPASPKEAKEILRLE